MPRGIYERTLNHCQKISEGIRGIYKKENDKNKSKKGGDDLFRSERTKS